MKSLTLVLLLATLIGVAFGTAATNQDCGWDAFSGGWTLNFAGPNFNVTSPEDEAGNSFSTGGYFPVLLTGSQTFYHPSAGDLSACTTVTNATYGGWWRWDYLLSDGYFDDGVNDAYDGVMYLEVENTTGSVLISSADIDTIECPTETSCYSSGTLNGITLTRYFWSPMSSSRDWVRIIDVISASASVDVNVYYYNELGCDTDCMLNSTLDYVASFDLDEYDPDTAHVFGNNEFLSYERDDEDEYIISGTFEATSTPKAIMTYLGQSEPSGGISLAESILSEHPFTDGIPDDIPLTNILNWVDESSASSISVGISAIIALLMLL